MSEDGGAGSKYTLISLPSGTRKDKALYYMSIGKCKNKIYVGRALRELLGNYILVYADAGAESILLKASTRDEPGSVTISANGSVSNAAIVREIESRGVELPAHYWHKGELENAKEIVYLRGQPYRNTTAPQIRAKRPRNSDLADMLPKR